MRLDAIYRLTGACVGILTGLFRAFTPAFDREVDNGDSERMTRLSDKFDEIENRLNVIEANMNYY